ncbi:hypothetical protein T4E_3316 [Trichinella pseudospiralis]|uniref:Uncharacterized protein n=1 Tax=Trichinella pseudospiralis TaxID=6337 RepID=A0A0V0XTZ6_TRIPS|nr:hypothetical protein T4E_3316 [Trichinella pseudospiralis]
MGRKILPLPAMSQELEIPAYKNLALLSEHTVWYMDGTECYQRKDIGIYVEIFNALIAKAAALRVKAFQLQTIISNFETALYPAVQRSFPSVRI